MNNKKHLDIYWKEMQKKKDNLLHSVKTGIGFYGNM